MLRWIALVISILLIFFSGVALIYAQYTIFLGAIVGGIVLALLFFKSKEQQERIDEFENWLVENKDKILSTGATYKGQPVSKDTILIRYLFVISIAILTFRIPSRFYIRDSESTGFVSFIYTLFTLLFGWWGIPWGPIYTVQAVIKNLSGGHQYRIATLLEPPEEQPKRKQTFLIAIFSLFLFIMILILIFGYLGY